jgi:uncharacterized membrane protein YkoI
MVRHATIALFLLLTIGIGNVNANSCLSAEETRVKIQEDDLVPLQDIVRNVRSAHDVELISARLCETNGNMVYMIAVLGRNGRVMRMTVNARSGEIINHR